MNKERLLDLANMIENEELPIRFEMNTYTNVCNTAGCIGGWAVVAAHGSIRAFYKLNSPLSIRGEAARILGLTFEEAQGLFEPEGFFLSAVTNKIAAKALRLVAEGMSISQAWKVARGKE